MKMILRWMEVFFFPQAFFHFASLWPHLFYCRFFFYVASGGGEWGMKTFMAFIIFMAQYLGKEGSLSKHQEANIVRNTQFGPL